MLSNNVVNVFSPEPLMDQSSSASRNTNIYIKADLMNVK